jgi:hypothetical protein
MMSTRGVFSLLAALVLWSGGGFGCGEGVSPGPEPAAREPVEEWDALPPPGEDAEEAPDVSAAWNSPSRSCEGLVPSGPGEGRFVSRDSEGEQCLPGAADGRGDLALGIFSAMLDSASWGVFTPEGTPSGSFSGGVVNVLLPQKSGFQLVSLAFGSRLVSFRAFSRTGAPLVQRELLGPSTGVENSWSAVVDPRGGSVVSWVRFGATPGTWQVVVQRFGTPGQPRSPLLVAREGTGTPPPFTLVGADTQGRALVLWNEPGTSSLRGRWLRRNETFTSDFLVLSDATGLSTPREGGTVLSPLIGGGLALNLGGEWVASIASKKTSVSPAPAWLAARPGTTFSIIRGGRGYALLSSAPEAQNELEILAPAGNSCGEVRLPAEDLREVRVGRDGTVIARVTPAEDFVCTWRYWSRLLH